MIIGVTGGIGSGKSTVVNLFAQKKNVAVYVADIEAKKLIQSSSSIQQKIKKEFGNKAYVNDKLNRTFIAEIVFNNAQKLAKLNSIIHPEVQKDFLKFVKENSKKNYVVYESALLFETGSNVMCTIIICVSAPLQTRIERVVKRDGIRKEDVVQRIQNQWVEDKKLLQSHYNIVNILLENTVFEVKKIHNILTKQTV